MLPFIRHHDTRHPAAMGETEVLAFPNRLVAMLLYGSGLRLMEPLSFQVKDFDFTRREVVVRRGKGGKDRVTMLPERLVAPLSRHLERVRAMHGRDLAWGGGAVALPDALERKVPSAGLAWTW